MPPGLVTPGGGACDIYCEFIPAYLLSLSAVPPGIEKLET